MALPSHPAQASARMARPSRPSTRSLVSMGKVPPLIDNRGSTTYSPLSSQEMRGEYSPTAPSPLPSLRAILIGCLAYGLMAPKPAIAAATTPSLSRSSFYRPTPSAAVSADVLGEVEETSLSIAVAVAKGRWVPDDWALAHLAWHLDLLVANGPTTLEALTYRLNRLMGNPFYSWGLLGPGLFDDDLCPDHLRAVGRAINKAKSRQGYTATLLLRWLLIPAAKGLLAPSPARTWVGDKLLSGLANSPSPA